MLRAATPIGESLRVRILQLFLGPGMFSGIMNNELAQKYWELGNAIVAFSVLQILAFLYALAGKEFRRQVEEHYRLAQIAVLVGSLL